MLQTVDIVVIVGWLALTVAVGVWFSHRAKHTVESFFVTDRNLPWWVVGTSMVATTFAADTPLVVSGWVASRGVAENWVWWTLGLAGPVSVFLFAPLWRRSGLVTDAELMELRYPGSAGRGLRGLKAAWFGILTNLLVIAWVMRAMAKIVTIVLGLDADDAWLGVQAETWVVLALFALTAAYTTHGGLLGVVVTDLMQFGLAIGAAIGLALLAWQAAGGLDGLQAGFVTHGFDWARTTALIPTGDPAADGASARWIVMLGVLWWGQTNVDGGGYLAQRLFAAKDEQHALGAYLWFVVAHLCIRPWPWVIVGLAGMAMLGPVQDPETYYPRMMALLLAPGWFGLMLASFLAAFMSTVDTQLNWGASLAVNDLYRRFLVRDRAPEHYVQASRVMVLVLALLGALVSFAIDEIGGAWKLALSVTAGLGAVYVARWYWWRVTAWCEISAMLFAGTATLLLIHLDNHHPATAGPAAYAWLAAVPAGWLKYPFGAAFTTLASLPLWIAVAFLTSGGHDAHLRAFYLRVRPGGPGWRAVAGELPGFAADGPTRADFVGILGCIVGIYGCLLGIGGALLGQGGFAIGGALGALVGFPIAMWAVNARRQRVPHGG